ncbi:MAG: SEC-C domain-containing protein [Anaerolineales bacterium]
MKALLTGLLIVLVVFAVLALGSGAVVLFAYGLGWSLNFVMHFDPFQATLVSLAGMLVFGIFAERIFRGMLDLPRSSSDFDDDDEEYDDEDYDDEDEYDDEEEEDEPVSYPGIPRWRQPLKTPDFSNTKPDDRCPCGSGRKYKNCHGSKRPS